MVVASGQNQETSDENEGPNNSPKIHSKFISKFIPKFTHLPRAIGWGHAGLLEETIKEFEINSKWSVITLFKDDYMKLENVKGYYCLVTVK